MKSIINKIVWVFALLSVLFACSKDETLRDTVVTEVKNIYEPLDNKSVVLQSAAGASVYFEWEAAKAEDSGMVLYEVAFDEAGGDFSTPLYKMASDNNGAYNHATITHKVLDKIMALAGIEPGNKGQVIWTVISSKGVNEKKSTVTRNIEVTRLVGFPDVTAAFLTGEATEGGADLANAVPMKAIETGVFEAYTKLTAGKTYHITDAKTGTPNTFYVDGGKIKAGTNSITVTKTGVYRVVLDFSVASSSYTEITDLQVYFCPTDALLFSLNYIGGGVFKASSKPITFKQEGWGRDERYKFKMTTINGAGETVPEWWGTPNKDSRPDGTLAYYFIEQVDILSFDRWDGKFKFAGEMDNALVDVSVIFKADGHYTHEVVKVGNQ